MAAFHEEWRADAINRLIEILVDALVKEGGVSVRDVRRDDDVRNTEQQSGGDEAVDATVSGMCRTEIWCAVIVPWRARGEGATAASD